LAVRIISFLKLKKKIILAINTTQKFHKLVTM